MSSREGSIVRGDGIMHVIGLLKKVLSSALYNNIDVIGIGDCFQSNYNNSGNIISLNFKNYLKKKSKHKRS